MNPASAQRDASSPWLPRLAPLLFAIASIALATLAGCDLNWDLLNYHYYNGWAFVSGRLDTDVAPAQLQTYFNPLLDVPLYFAIQHLPPWWVGASIALLQSCNAELVRRIARHALPPLPRRELIAFLLGLLALCGAVFRGEVGGSKGDTLVTLLVLASVLLLVARRDALAVASTRNAAPWLLTAGLCAGAAGGLKLVMLIHALAFGLATIALDARPWLQRWRFPLLFGIGACAGWLLLDGWWMLRLWQQYRNPLFPFFNDLFHAPLAPGESFSDHRFLPRSFSQALIYPLAWLRDPHLVSDGKRFFDLRIPLLFVTGVIWLVACTLRRSPSMLKPAARFVLLGSALGYVLWLGAFGIIRYAALLELLAPLGIVVLASDLLGVTRRAAIAAAALGVLLVLAVRPLGEARGTWQRTDYFSVAVPQAVHADPQALVLLGGISPTAFVLPSLPFSQRLLRVQGNFTGGAEEDGMDRYLLTQVAAHEGSLVALAPSDEMRGMDAILARYGLRRSTATSDCASIATAAQDARPPMLNGPLLWCPLERAAAGAAHLP